MALILLFALTCQAAGSTDNPIPPDQRRDVEQTFLTFPEWFLVHSPAEYAYYVTDHVPHGFPFIGHIGQLWSSYASVTREQIRSYYPANIGYHAMIFVIATSTTVEYALRWAYENTLGRVSWALSSGHLTAEDRYGAAVAQDYVDFIRHRPWYQYDFSSKLTGLWRTLPMKGDDLIRKWERRYALTTEYSIKALYAKLIEWVTGAAYDPALMTTQVVVEGFLPGSSLPDGSHMQVVRQLPGGRTIMNLPRYFEFRIAAMQLAQRGIRLINIAGNDTVILVTLWIPQGMQADKIGGRVLFEQPLLTMPGQKRVALVLPVWELSPFLLTAASQGIQVEHVYDY